MSENDDLLQFADEDEPHKSADDHAQHWRVLVVDDEPEVHDVTRLALKNFAFAGRGLQIDSAFSSADAKVKLRQNDYAVVLLDVVMETDHAGLDLVQWIREELNNGQIRIILRTGQPGQAPEKKVIMEYDINDYKEKTELTSNRLHTTMFASLRSYRDIMALYRNKLGLEAILMGTDKIFSQHSINDFTQGALEQLATLIRADQGAFFGNVEGLAATKDEADSRVLAATGQYRRFIAKSLEQAMVRVADKGVVDALNQEGLTIGDDFVLAVYSSHLRRKNILYMEGLPELSSFDSHLLNIFCNHLGIAFDNIAMLEEMEVTQRELVYRLSEAVESRSKETSNHVKRVAHTCRLLGELCGIDGHQLEVLFAASPLHDIGKIAIPDSILNKPGKLTAEEWEVMKSHALIGYEILKDSRLEILNAGAVIALDHHEKWNGSGYPKGKKGEEIHILGRISAIADVFDALYNARCYKPAWPINEIVELFEHEKAQHFDPQLVELLLYRLDDFVAIQKRFAD